MSSPVTMLPTALRAALTTLCCWCVRSSTKRRQTPESITAYRAKKKLQFSQERISLFILMCAALIDQLAQCSCCFVGSLLKAKYTSIYLNIIRLFKIVSELSKMGTQIRKLSPPSHRRNRREWVNNHSLQAFAPTF